MKAYFLMKFSKMFFKQNQIYTLNGTKICITVQKMVSLKDVQSIWSNMKYWIMPRYVMATDMDFVTHTKFTDQLKMVIKNS